MQMADNLVAVFLHFTINSSLCTHTVQLLFWDSMVLVAPQVSPLGGDKIQEICGAEPVDGLGTDRLRAGK